MLLIFAVYLSLNTKVAVCLLPTNQKICSFTVLKNICTIEENFFNYLVELFILIILKLLKWIYILDDAWVIIWNKYYKRRGTG